MRQQALPGGEMKFLKILLTGVHGRNGRLAIEKLMWDM
jgi:hypothetical protein